MHGRCVDRAGLAVIDAEVSLLELTWRNPDTDKWTNILADDARDSTFLTSARSTADGSFRVTTDLIDPTPPDSVIVTVLARKPGLCSGRHRTDGSGQLDIDIGDLVLQPSTRVAGHVRDTLGRACAGVHVYISKAPNLSDGTHSKEDGSFSLEYAPASECKLTAEADDLRETSLDLDLSNGEPRLDLEVVLAEPNGLDSISGMVVDPEGKPVPAAGLDERTTAGPEPWLNLTTRCDERGRFRIDGHLDSVFEITADDRAGRWSAVRMSDIHSGTHGIVLKLDDTHMFTLRVRSATGEPIERFGLQRSSTGSPFIVPSEVSAHPGGEVRLPSDLAPFRMNVFAPGWCASDVGPLDPKNLPEIVDVVLDRACMLRGVVISKGSGMKKARVSIAESHFQTWPKQSPFEPRPPTALSDGEGHFELSLEGTGSVRLQARVMNVVTPLSAPIDVRPGVDVDGIVLEVAEAGWVAGRVVSFDGLPGKGVGVLAVRAGVEVGSAQVDEQGNYRIEGLYEGDYELVIAPTQAIHFGRNSTKHTSEAQRWPCSIQNAKGTTLDLLLLEPARVRVVLDLPQPPRAEWTLSMSSHLPGTTQDLSDRVTRGHDNFDFEFIDPVEASIELECSLSGWPRLSAKRQSIERGAQEIPIVLRAGRIEGTGVFPIGALEVVVLSWQDGSLSAHAETKLDNVGRFAFECAPAGECSLRRANKSAVARSVVIKAGETARVDGL